MLGLEVFVLFSPLWWVLSIGAFISLVWAISHEEHAGKLATFVFAVYVAAQIAFGNFKPWELLYNDPINFAVVVGSYLAIGGIWAGIHWYIRCLHRRSEYNDELTNWLVAQGVSEEDVTSPPSVPEHLKKAWTDYCLRSDKWSKYKAGRQTIQIVPLIREHKSEFALSWLAWPAVMFWSFFDDILRALGRSLYEFFGRRLQRLASLAFRGTEEHFVEGEDTPPVQTDVEKPKSWFGKK